MSLSSDDRAEINQWWWSVTVSTIYAPLTYDVWWCAVINKVHKSVSTEFHRNPEHNIIDHHYHYHHYDHNHDQERESFILQSIVSCRSHRFIKQYKTAITIIFIIYDGIDDEV